MLTVDDAVLQRRSVRGFLVDEVPQQVLEEVFTLAQQAPSNCNVQPWVPHVVSGSALARLRAALVEAGQNELAPDPDWPAEGKFDGIYRARQVDAAVQLYGAMGVPRADLVARRVAYLRNLDCFGAPHTVFIFMQHPFDTREASDIGIYAQTLMLLLASRGIASCAQGALGLYPGIVRRQLSLPDSLRLLFGVSFGYEDTAAPANAARVGRASLGDAACFHR